MIRLAVTRLAWLLVPALLSCSAGTGSPRPSPPPVSKSAPVIGKKTAAPRVGKVTAISVAQAFPHQQRGDALIIDVRPGFIYGLGHIPGAVSWPKNSYDSGLPLHEPQIVAAHASHQPVVIYCVDTDCPDGRTVADRLALRGHSVSVLEGGWDAWKSAGLPTE